MTNSHVIATSEDLSTSHTLLVSSAGFLGGFHGLRLVTEDVVYIWNYRSSVSRQAQAGGKRSLKIVLFFFEVDCLCARIWILLEMHCKRKDQSEAYIVNKLDRIELYINLNNLDKYDVCNE